MSLLGFDFGATGGALDLMGDTGVLPKPTDTGGLPKVKFRLSENVRVYLKNSFDKEAEQELQNYIHHLRQKNVRLREIILDEKTRGANISTLEKLVKMADAEINRDSPQSVQQRKSFIVLYETMEYLFNNYPVEEAFLLLKRANVPRQQFDWIWECMSNKVSKADCVDQIMMKPRRKRN